MTDADFKWYQVSLRLFGDSLDPQTVEHQLNLGMTHTGRKGEPAGGKPGRAKYETNFWVHTHTIDSKVAFAEQVSDLLDVLESKRPEFLQLVTRPGIGAELFLGFSSGSGQGGAYFPPELIGRIAALGLAINLDLYAPEIGE